MSKLWETCHHFFCIYQKCLSKIKCHRIWDQLMLFLTFCELIIIHYERCSAKCQLNYYILELSRSVTNIYLTSSQSLLPSLVHLPLIWQYSVTMESSFFKSTRVSKITYLDLNRKVHLLHSQGHSDNYIFVHMAKGLQLQISFLTAPKVKRYFKYEMLKGNGFFSQWDHSVMICCLMIYVYCLFSVTCKHGEQCYVAYKPRCCV